MPLTKTGCYRLTLEAALPGLRCDFWMFKHVEYNIVILMVILFNDSITKVAAHCLNIRD